MCSPASPPQRSLLIFVKHPRHAKSRLARELGRQRAQAAYGELLALTATLARKAREAGARVTWCHTPDDPAGLPLPPGARLRPQGDGDLGARMARALRRELAAGRAPLLIGSDCPTLRLSHLRQGWEALTAGVAVLGPARDGGYYLVGLPNYIEIFDDIPWSSARVRAATEVRLRAAEARYRLLPELEDVDDAASYRRWRGA